MVVKRDRFVAILAVICVVGWILAAIRPVDRQAWALENILVVFFAIVIGFSHRRLQLSNASYLFLTLFVILHLVGAHYTYAKMPLGLWAKDYFHFSRNHFDRVAHFGFGLFLAYPIRELLRRFSGISRGWSLWTAAGIVLGVSGFFEILESIVAEIVAPGQGVNWLGGQGDEWDAQNDMLSAMVGALLTMGIVSIREMRPPLPEGKEEMPVRLGPQDQVRENFHRSQSPKRFLFVAVGAYLVLWIALAIKPLDRGDWFLENLLIFVTVAVLSVTYRRFQFSNQSYLLILIFMAFHTIGAHYTYAKVPAGFWMQHWFHLSRNHYDRVIHFGFGFLLLYPMAEVLIRSARIKPLWAPWLAAAALWALSSFFEIVEAVVAMIVRQDLGAAYL